MVYNCVKIFRSDIMPGKLKNLLDRSLNNKSNLKISDIKNSKTNFIPFRFEGTSYYLAMRGDTLVFDEDHNLLYTFTPEQLAVADAPFLKKVNQVVLDNTNEKIILYINRDTGVESLTFSSQFDATYIFNKLRRIARRPSECIDSIIIEKNSTIVNTFNTNHSSSLFANNNVVENREERLEEKTEYIASLSRVEDIIDNLICNNISRDGLQKSDERLQKCIEILQDLQTK